MWGSELDLKKNRRKTSTCLFERVFRAYPRPLKLKSVELALNEVMNKGGSSNDVVALISLYVCSRLRCAPRAKGCIPIGLFQYVEDVDHLWNYSWGVAVHRVLLKGIKAFVADFKGGTSKVKGFLCGCKFALFVSVLAHLNTIEFLPYFAVSLHIDFFGSVGPCSTSL